MTVSRRLTETIDESRSRWPNPISITTYPESFRDLGYYLIRRITSSCMALYRPFRSFVATTTPLRNSLSLHNSSSFYVCTSLSRWSTRLCFGRPSGLFSFCYHSNRPIPCSPYTSCKTNTLSFQRYYYIRQTFK